MNPYLLFGLLGLGGAALVTPWVSLFIHPIAAWLAATNLSALVMYRADKSLAQSDKLRVPEMILLMLEAVGGTFGAGLAMWMMRPRHKTQSRGFLVWFFGILVLQVLLAFLFFLVAK